MDPLRWDADISGPMAKRGNSGDMLFELLSLLQHHQLRYITNNIEWMSYYCPYNNKEVEDR